MGIKKGGLGLLVLLLLLSTILWVTDVSKEASDPNLSINQVESKLPDVTLFVGLDNVDMSSAKLEKNLSIKLTILPPK